MNLIKVLLVSFVYFLNSCNFSSQKEITLSDKERVYKFLKEYISKTSINKEYNDLQTVFNCFHKNATEYGRKNYPKLDSLKNEEFLGLDSLIIFNPAMDSAIVFFISKLANYNEDGFAFYAHKLFAFKSSNNWNFYDGCGTAVYPTQKYTLEMARNNQRLWFAFDGEWLKNWNTDQIKENPAFIHHACEMWCGPCADKRDSLNMNIYYLDINKHTPPDSLYRCN